MGQKFHVVKIVIVTIVKMKKQNFFNSKNDFDNRDNDNHDNGIINVRFCTRCPKYIIDISHKLTTKLPYFSHHKWEVCVYMVIEKCTT